MTSAPDFIVSSAGTGPWSLDSLIAGLKQIRSLRFGLSEEPAIDPWEGHDPAMDGVPHDPNDDYAYTRTFRADGALGPQSVLLSYGLENTYSGLSSVVTVAGLDRQDQTSDFRVREPLRPDGANLITQSGSRTHLEALIDHWIAQVSVPKIFLGSNDEKMLEALDAIDRHKAEAFRPGLAHVRALLATDPASSNSAFRLVLPSPYESPFIDRGYFGPCQEESLLTRQGNAVLSSLFPMVTHHTVRYGNTMELSHEFGSLPSLFYLGPESSIFEKMRLLAPFAHLGPDIFVARAEANP